MASRALTFGERTYNISYEIINPNSQISALILHGWGANKELMMGAFKKMALRQIYVDLPGFGNSDISVPLRTSDYAKIIEIFLREIKCEPKIIIGHSFGGKVATLLNPQILVLLSSAGILEEKPASVKIKIKIYKALKSLGLGKFWRFFASNDVNKLSPVMYETMKNVVDEDFSEIFGAFKNRALIFWGKADSATHLKSGEKIHSLIANSQFYALEGDHFFFLKNADFISEQISLNLEV